MAGDAVRPSAPVIMDVSVVMPVRNGMPHLAVQLDALARQTYQGRWEVIISDNGSTDDSADAVRAVADRVPLRVIDSRDAPGAAGARAAAARAAQGRLLLFCDCDDVAADDWVDRMVAALDRYPAVGGHIDDTSLNTESVMAWRPQLTPGELPRPFGLLPHALAGNCGLRREVYEEVGGFDPSFKYAAEETDLFWRVQLAGYQLGYAPDAVVSCRHRHDLRSMLRQWRSYGRGRARLVARYQALGLLPAESWRDAAGTVGWLSLHAVDCLRGQARRACYLRVLAHVAGQVQGSREVGVLHIRREDSRRDGERSLRDVLAGAGLAGAGSAGCQPGDAQAG
jgi:GT2 family glycosyltransferase